MIQEQRKEDVYFTAYVTPFKGFEYPSAKIKEKGIPEKRVVFEFYDKKGYMTLKVPIFLN